MGKLVNITLVVCFGLGLPLGEMRLADWSSGWVGGAMLPAQTAD